MSDYEIKVFWSEEDHSWVADVPDLRYCSAFGDSPLQAYQEALRAREAWLQSAREHGDSVPEPRYRAARRAAN